MKKKRLWEKLLFLCMLLILNCNSMKVSAEGMSSATTLILGEKIEVTDVNDFMTELYYSFTPDESGNYKFQLTKTEEDLNYRPVIAIYDKDGNQQYIEKARIGDKTVEIIRHLVKGEKYYIQVYASESTYMEPSVMQLTLEEYEDTYMDEYIYGSEEPIYLYKNTTVVLSPPVYAGVGKTLAYQWYKGSVFYWEDGEHIDETMEKMPVTSSTYELVYGTDIADKYYCVVTDSSGEVFTKEYRIYDSVELDTAFDTSFDRAEENSTSYMYEAGSESVLPLNFFVQSLGTVKAKYYRENSDGSWKLLGTGEVSEWSENVYECTYKVSTYGRYKCVVTSAMDGFNTETEEVEFIVHEIIEELPVELSAETTKLTIKYDLPVTMKVNATVLDDAYANRIGYSWYKVREEYDGSMEESESQEKIEGADTNTYSTAEPGFYFCYAIDKDRNEYQGYEELPYVVFEVVKDNTPCTHVWDEGMLVKNPTATETGLKKYTCKQCKITKDEGVAALGVPKKGTVLKDAAGTAIYKVTKAGKTVEYVAPVKKKSTIEIPETVTIDGVVYKVTSIAQNAFKNNKTLKKVVVGKNVSKIGKQAFWGCKKLKSIKIKTKSLSLKKVGSKVFKGIHSKATVYVPKNKMKAYKAILKKRGIGSKVKVKKI